MVGFKGGRGSRVVRVKCDRVKGSKGWGSRVVGV